MYAGYPASRSDAIDGRDLRAVPSPASAVSNGGRATVSRSVWTVRARAGAPLRLLLRPRNTPRITMEARLWSALSIFEVRVVTA